MNMTKIVAVLGLALSLWLPQHAHANTCELLTSDGQMGRFRLPPVTWDGTFNPNAIPVNGEIKRLTFTYATIENPGPGRSYGAWTCEPETTKNLDRLGTTGAYTMINIPSLGGSVAVYPTTVPGVGIHITYRPGGGQSWGFPQTFVGTNPYYQMATFFNLTFVLVKTGPITSGGVLAGEVAGEFLRDHGNQQVISYLWDGDIPIKPLIPTCTPTVADKIVDMGSVDVGSITDDGYSNSVAFNMDVVCDGGSPADTTQQMSVTFTDATNASNTTDKLLLTPASTATGVKVQLLQGGTPVTFGPEPTNGADTAYSRALGTIKNGTYSFPLAARYVQTGSVTAGSANAMATFTYTYH